MKSFLRYRYILVLLLLVLLHGVAAAGAGPASLLRDGDLIFQTSRSSQSLAIQRATGSPYSHMGIIFFRKGIPLVFEAVGTVRYTPLAQWIARGEGGHFVVKRLIVAGGVLDSASVEKLRKQARRFEGRPYDPFFEWSDERIYCSELVWKIYERALGVRIGALRRMKDFRLDDPAVRARLRERFGTAIPLDEPVISPGAMLDAPNLTSVTQQ